MWHRSSKASRGAMHVVWQSVAVETVVKAEQDGRGGRQTKELMRETGDFSHVTPPRPRLSEDLHVLPPGLLASIYHFGSKCAANGVICFNRACVGALFTFCLLDASGDLGNKWKWSEPWQQAIKRLLVCGYKLKTEYKVDNWIPGSRKRCSI